MVLEENQKTVKIDGLRHSCLFINHFNLELTMNTSSLQYIDRSLSVGSLGSYLHWVNQLPMLSLEEEQRLANNLRKNNDLESARQLILSHLRLVARIARGYKGYGLALADLIQEGNIGLMKAVKRFDPKVGVRLVSFAVHWVRAEIHEFVLKNWRIVKVATTKAQRKLFFNIRKHSKQRGWFSNDEVKAVAEELNVSHKDVRQMEARLSHYDQAFDGEDHDEGDGMANWTAPANYLEDQRANPEHQIESGDWSDKQESQLYSALSTLDERSQNILQKRWLSEKKATLHELADQYGVSAERIRQLEQGAMHKIRGALTA